MKTYYITLNENSNSWEDLHQTPMQFESIAKEAEFCINLADFHSRPVCLREDKNGSGTYFN